MTAEEFRERRKLLFKSQAQAAAALGTGQAAISHYELGRRPVPGTILRLLECIEAQRLEPEEVH